MPAKTKQGEGTLTLHARRLNFGWLTASAQRSPRGRKLLAAAWSSCAPLPAMQWPVRAPESLASRLGREQIETALQEYGKWLDEGEQIRRGKIGVSVQL